MPGTSPSSGPAHTPLRCGGGRERARLARKLAATAAVLAVVGAIADQQTSSSLNDVTTNPGNAFASGTVKLSDNDAGSALLSLANAKPGATTAGCIVVTYTGTLAANVRIFGTTTGTGLDQYLDLTVTRGTISGSPGAGSCTDFTADSTDYVGRGNGVIYDATLAAFPSSSSTALLDPTSGSGATWTTNAAHAYRIQVTLQGAAAGQGKTASQSFTWEATNT